MIVADLAGVEIECLLQAFLCFFWLAKQFLREKELSLFREGWGAWYVCRGDDEPSANALDMLVDRNPKLFG